MGFIPIKLIFSKYRYHEIINIRVSDFITKSFEMDEFDLRVKRVVRKYRPQKHMQLDNVLFAPLNVLDQTIGIIGIANKPGGFNERDVYMTKMLADLAVVALTHARALDSLKESQDMFSKAFNNLPVMITISNIEDGAYLEVNEAFVNNTGYTRNNAIGKTSVELGFITRQDLEFIKKRFEMC